MIGRRLLAAAVMGAWTLAGCASAPSGQAPPSPLPEQPGCALPHGTGSLCVLVLGDSIAAGVPVTGDDRWWVRLGSLLQAAVPDRRVIVDSWAVPGSRVDVLESAARDQPALDTYDFAIVIEGVNDEGNLSIAAWRARYEAAIAAIERRGLVVVVGTPPPSFENGAFAIRYDPTAAALREVAAAGRRPLLDIAARWHADGAAIAATYYSDLIHQADAGQLVMAEMARDVVLEAIGASAATDQPGE